MSHSAEVIALDDGIERVAAKFARNYEPYQRRADAAWSDWQRAVRTLGVPQSVKNNKRIYQLPSIETVVDAYDDEDRVVSTLAEVSVRGILKHVRHARRAMRILQRCEANEISILPAGANTLWGVIEDETEAYTVKIIPKTPNLSRGDEYVRRLRPPTRMQWMEAIDVDGPQVRGVYELVAEEHVESLHELMDFVRPRHPSPGPGNGDMMPALGWHGTEAGIAL